MNVHGSHTSSQPSGIRSLFRLVTLCHRRLAYILLYTCRRTYPTGHNSLLSSWSGKHLQIILYLQTIGSIFHHGLTCTWLPGVPWSLLTSNILSAWYRLASGIMDDLVSFFVVYFSVSASCAKLRYHLSLISSGVVLECWFYEKKVLGNPISGSKPSCSSLSSEKIVMHLAPHWSFLLQRLLHDYIFFVEWLFSVHFLQWKKH